jgi:Cu-processing system permease protein
MNKFTLVKYQILDGLRSKAIIGFGIFFAIVSELLIRFGGTGDGTMLSLMNLSLSIIPLCGLIFGTIYVYNNREYIELMLSQPIRRRDLYISLYAGLVVPLMLAYMVGVGVPITARLAFGPFVTVVGTGLILMAIFVAIAFVIALNQDDKIRGMGLAIVSWLVLTILYDALIMFVIAMFAEYPLERPVLALTLANPVDLGRIILVLSADESAMMGFTGALYRQFFGSSLGIWVSVSMLAIWAVVPVMLGGRRFVRKDF